MYVSIYSRIRRLKMNLEQIQEAVIELRLEALKKLETLQVRLSDGWIIDWNNPDQLKYYIAFDENGNPTICKRKFYSLAGGVFFMSEADTQEAIRNLGSMIYHLYSTVDDNISQIPDKPGEYGLKLYPGIVKMVAEEMFSKNKDITSLEVKLDLRNNGYVATQKQVSIMLAALATEHAWTKIYDPSGFYHYRII